MSKTKMALLSSVFGVLVGFSSLPPVLAASNITWGKPTEVTSFDPQRSGDGAAWDLFYLVYEQLLSTDANFQLVPRLAERWEQISPTSYRFFLAPDAAFSNGRPLKAEDVVLSFKRITDPKTGGIWGKQLGKFTDIVAENDLTVRFDLEEPSTGFLSVLAVSPTSIVPVKEIEEGKFDPKTTMLGSGPFMVVEHVQDQYWKLARNPHYRRKGYPLVDEFTVKVLPNDSARIAALRDGQIDIATFDAADTPQFLKREPNVKVTKQTTTNYYRLDVNARTEGNAFADLRVRQAMNYAIDRDAIAKIVFNGEVTAETPIPKALAAGACDNDPFYAAPRSQRLTKARALLKEAKQEGAEIGIIGAATLSTYSLIAQVIQANLNEVGFHAKVEKIPTADWYQRVFVAKPRFDLAVSWFAGYTDPGLILYWWTPDGAKGWADGYMIPDDGLTAAIRDVRSKPTGPARSEAMKVACTAINADANMIALVGKVDYVAVRDDLVNAQFDAKEANFRTFKHAEEFSRKR